MAGRLARLIERGARLIECADPEPAPTNQTGPGLFRIGTVFVEGIFTGGDESVTLTTSGGQQEKFRGTLVVSRLRYPARPVLMSIIVEPDGTRARIAGLTSDNASWTLTLTTPNARRN